VSAGGTGRLLGIGVGPGDPELLTLKAARLLREAPVVAYFAKAGQAGRAHATIAALLRPDVVLLPLLYPVTTEIPHHHPDYRARIEAFFDEAAAQVAAHLDSGRDVAVTSEGDPLFYGSYMHLHARLATRYAAEVVPGVTGMSACWSMAGAPIAQGEDVLSVLPGTLDEAELARRLRDANAAVIMKVGRNLPKIRRALAQAGLLDRAIYAERATMPEGHAMPLAARDDAPAPYFSIVLVPGWAGP
jgi:precorrin-2/cobalt-factor-2 C20-methyltransferase